ncbi:MAG: adenine phosphoribosyltransferase [Dehalococcoidia bacterium]|nr:adenine phosphoribosyltransferase [Dehalococcoidia bacterium]
MDLAKIIRDVPDFPQPGVVFKDITPLLQNPAAFAQAMDAFVAHYQDRGIQDVVAIESRGFIFGAPLALRLGAGFVPIRKKGKLPRKTVGMDYGLEYGRESVELHEDGVLPGKRVLIVDDVLATGGTAVAAKALVEKLGGKVEGLSFLIELEYLKGREKLGGADVFSIIRYLE